jgi:hypothetical protein
VAKIVPPEAQEASGAIKFDLTLFSTSPDCRLAFLPVVSHGVMQPEDLCRLQAVQESLLSVLPKLVDAQRGGGNVGHSIGYTVVSGGIHAGRGIEGSVHLNKHLEKYPELQKEVFAVVSDILLSTYGKRTWFVELVRRLTGGDIPEKCFLPGLPVSHILLTDSPKPCDVQCDRNSLGATFVFTAETVAGGDLIVDRPVGSGYQLNTYHLTAGRVVGGSWGQYAHCNLPVLDHAIPQRSWIVYLDYRTISARYKNCVPVSI